MPSQATTTQRIHTLIVGAGPAGLAAAYSLAKAGITPVVIEQGEAAGGLMRSIRRGDFVVDIGRKELYTRIHKVDTFWKEILGDDYIAYMHREGILYGGRIVETSRTWRGVRRGMPWGLVLACGVDYLRSYVQYTLSQPRNYEEYCYKRRGRRLSQIVSQGYEEKFKGKRWRDMAPPSAALGAAERDEATTDPLFHEHAEERAKTLWRHPAQGSGQICECLEKSIRELGGQFLFKAKVLEMTVSQGCLESVKVAVESEIFTYQPLHVISSIPLEFLMKLLNQPAPLASETTQSAPALASQRRSTICVYLFLDEPPRFPHVWLKVTCPEMKAGRITNYAALNGTMVPPGKTCLCIEFFCLGSDPLLALQQEELLALALAECAKAGLIDPHKCFDSFVLKLPGADAATSWRDWGSESTRHLLATLHALENLYNVNRPGTDKATYAGLEAAAAILAGDRTIFDHETSVTIPIAMP